MPDGQDIRARARAIGLFVRDEVELLLLGALDLRTGEDQAGRARAIAILVGDMAERIIHESVALLHSVTHADLASFLRRLDATQQRQNEADAALAALAQQHALTLAEQRVLRALMESVVAGLRAQGGTDEPRDG